jgi:hypothetical protein
MSRGRTLWEMFTDWLAGPQEANFFNPLKAQLGRSVTFDDIEWRDRDFKLRKILQYKRVIEGREFQFVDYVLTERTVQGVETDMRLRINPTGEGAKGGEELYALMLFLEDEMKYDEGFHDVLRDPSGLFRIEHEGKVEAEFTRLHGLREPYKAAVTILADENADGKVAKDEIDVKRIEYWDFERDAADAAGQPEKEYLFVELDSNDGWFQIWRGKSYDPRKITVI